MPHNVQVLNSLASRQRRTDGHCPLHDPHSQVRIDLRVPVALLIATAQNRPAPGGAGHDVAGLVLAVVGPGEIQHFAGVVADHDDLAARGHDFAVLDAAQLAGHEPGAVHDDVDLLSTAERQGFGVEDVLESAAPECHAVGKTLGYEPGQVDSGVDADGSERRC